MVTGSEVCRVRTRYSTILVVIYTMIFGVIMVSGFGAINSTGFVSSMLATGGAVLAGGSFGYRRTYLQLGPGAELVVSNIFRSRRYAPDSSLEIRFRRSFFLTRFPEEGNYMVVFSDHRGKFGATATVGLYLTHSVAVRELLLLHLGEFYPNTLDSAVAGPI